MSTLLIPTPEELLLYRLLEQDPEPLSVAGIGEELKARLQQEIKVALDPIEDPVVLDLLRTIFDELLRVFNRLSLIESNLQKLDTLQENLSILELLQFEIRHLIDFINAKAIQRARRRRQVA